jgi:hypothetical protein
MGSVPTVETILEHKYCMSHEKATYLLATFMALYILTSHLHRIGTQRIYCGS